MTKRMRFGVLIYSGMLLLNSSAAWAQAGDDGVVTINGGRNAVLLRAPSQKSTPAARPSPGLVTIYSNLGKGNKVYSMLSGSGILGKNAGQMLPQSVANGFQPKADHTVTEIQVAGTHVQGNNSLVVSLNADNGNKPGKALHTWRFTNLPAFGHCCRLQTGKFAAGIKVKKGKMYWVVLRPVPQFQDTYDVWANNIGGLQGAYSNNTGSGWNPQSLQTLGGFGVFGK